ncbi:MAG: YjbQ family protein [Planctomycetes bacterium]|nr:YjbQ family protein [Planctomycetota bacterium]
MSWFQKSISIAPKSRGFHLVTSEFLAQVSEIGKYKVGLIHIMIQHTSASITINENADPDVRVDFESHFRHTVPDNASYYIHTYEGSDDMPAHLKSSLLGCEMTLPIADGCLRLGTWQGIYLCEHRISAGSRKLIVTLQGECY